MSMRIAIDLRSVHPGLTGMGRYDANLCLSIERTCGPNALIGITSSQAAEYLRSMTRVPLHVLTNHKSDAESVSLPDLLHEWGADLFHSPLFFLPSIKVCQYVCTIHDAIPLARPDLTPE